jgi:hypothetical protein
VALHPPLEERALLLHCTRPLTATLKRRERVRGLIAAWDPRRGRGRARRHDPTASCCCCRQ